MRAFPVLPMLMLAACATTASPPPSLAGTRWQLAEGKGALADQAAAALTADFTADSIGGNSGCNQYTGPYTLSGNTLTVGPVTATKRFCPGGGSEVESAWFGLLAEPLQVTQSGASLQLRGADGTTVTLKPR